VHTLEGWLTMAKQLEDMGAHSLCIKDMSGLLKPYDAEELISRLKETVSLPIALHCHATTGLSIATHMKAIDSGIDVIDTAISSMSMTYGHSPTETVVAMVENSPRDTGLDMVKLAEVATYFRDVRKKYAKFEGSLKGIDARILLAQVPGGMLTNMEMQLKEQGAADRLDDVLTEIPKVRKDLGYIPLVTPTSQIVGTQAVLNVLTGERYKSITKETAGVLKGEYGATADKVDAELQARVLDGAEAITCRPADLIKPEMDTLAAELSTIAQEKKITLADDVIDDVLTYALFPQIGLKFLENRNNPDAFEPVPTIEKAPEAVAATQPLTAPENYAVSVDGKVYDVIVAPGGDISQITHPAGDEAMKQSASVSAAEALNAPLAGNIFKVLVNEGDHVDAGEVVIIMEAMKMETEIRAVNAGEITALHIKEGDSVTVGQALLSLG
jgi:oxaloacetate decarboxylase alpha subunit